jgi:hypothetical protein
MPLRTVYDFGFRRSDQVVEIDRRNTANSMMMCESGDVHSIALIVQLCDRVIWPLAGFQPGLDDEDTTI